MEQVVDLVNEHKNINTKIKWMEDNDMVILEDLLIETPIAEQIGYQVQLNRRNDLGQPRRGRPSYDIEILKMFIRFQNIATKKNQEDFYLTGTSLEAFFGVSRDNIQPHIRKLVKKGFLTITKRAHVRKDYPHAFNFYTVDMPKALDYVKTVTHEEFVIDEDIAWNFINLLKKHHEDRYIASLPEDKQEAAKKRKEKKEAKRELEIQKYKEENKYYLDLTKDLEFYDNDIKYLDENSKRLYNKLCSTLNEKRELSDRIPRIQKMFRTNKNIEAFDTNASIYRLSKAMGNGTPYEHKDIYKAVFERCNFKLDKSFKELRPIFKQLFMPIYMKETSINWKCKRHESMKNWRYINQYDKPIYEYHCMLEETFNMDLKSLLFKVRDVLKEFLGLEKFYQAEIFIHESNFHILLLRRFQNMGLKVVNVYDCFYFEEGQMTQEMYDKIYDETIIEFLETEKRLKTEKQTKKLVA